MINREYKNPKIVNLCTFTRAMYIITLVIGMISFVSFLLSCAFSQSFDVSSLWIYCYMIAVPICGIAFFKTDNHDVRNERYNYLAGMIFIGFCLLIHIIFEFINSDYFRSATFWINLIAIAIAECGVLLTNINDLYLKKKNLKPYTITETAKCNNQKMTLRWLIFCSAFPCVLFLLYLILNTIALQIYSANNITGTGFYIFFVVLSYLIYLPTVAAGISCTRIYIMMRKENNEYLPEQTIETPEQEPKNSKFFSLFFKERDVYDDEFFDENEQSTYSENDSENRKIFLEKEKNKNFCKKMLSRCGMRFFVKYYDILKTWAIPDIMDEISENYTEDSKRERAECAQRIFSKNLQQVALGLVADDIHGIDEKTRLAAYEIIEKEKQQIEREEQNSSIGKTLE